MDKKMEQQLNVLKSALQADLLALNQKFNAIRAEISEKQLKVTAIDQLIGSKANAISPGEKEEERDGDFTPVKNYWRPILEVLTEIGGKGRRERVIALVGEKMKNVLTSADRARLPKSSSNQIRWENRVAWQVSNMKTVGLVNKDSQRGVWEITPEGRNWLDTN
jgi:hypothetical protein